MVGAVALGAALGLPAAVSTAASAATVQPQHPATGASAQGPAQTRQAAARATLTLTLKAGTALPGQSVGFAGRGFKAGEKVALH